MMQADLYPVTRAPYTIFFAAIMLIMNKCFFFGQPSDQQAPTSPAIGHEQPIPIKRMCEHVHDPMGSQGWRDPCTGRWAKWGLFVLLVTMQVPGSAAGFLKGDKAKDYLFSGEGSHVRDLDEESFRDETGNPGPLLVNFYSPWCGHCIHYAPVYQKLAEDLTKSKSAVRITAVSCTPNSKLCKSEGIQSYPSVRAWGFPGITNGYAIPSRYDDAVRKWVQSGLPDDSFSQGGEKPPAAAPAKPPPEGEVPPPKEVAVDDEANVDGLRSPRLQDALTSVVFTFEKEVFLGVRSLQPSVLLALRSFLHVLSLSFPGTQNRRAFSRLLSELDGVNALSIEDWDEKVDRLVRKPLFPKAQLAGLYKWGFCEQEGKNGYTCGLWTLFHILTVKSGELSSGATPVVTIEAIHDFVQHFFGCEMCRTHFLGIYEANSFNRMAVYDSQPDDNHALVLWLWEFHNGVNVRVAMEGAAAKKEQGGGAFDWDTYADKLWPSAKSCPHCWVSGDAERRARPTDFATFSEEQYAAYMDAAAQRDEVYRLVVQAYAIGDSLAGSDRDAKLLVQQQDAMLLLGLKESALYYGVLGAICIIFMLLVLRHRSLWKVKTLTGRHKKVDSWMNSFAIIQRLGDTPC